MKNLYLVALQVGGAMEIPDVSFQDFHVIKAKNREDAELQYNTQKRKVSYFYGACVAEKINGEVKILKAGVDHEEINRLIDKH